MEETPLRITYKPCDFPHQTVTKVRYAYLELGQDYIRHKLSCSGETRPDGEEENEYAEKEPKAFFYDYSVKRASLIGVDIVRSHKYKPDVYYYISIVIKGAEDWNIWFDDEIKAREAHETIWRYIFNK